MSDDRVLAKKSDITFFGDIVRSKKGITTSLSLEQVKEGVAELKGATDEWNGDYSEEGENLVVPSGSLDITENGEYDVVDKANVNVNVAGSGGDNEIIEDIKQTLIDKGLATEETRNEELCESIKNEMLLTEMLKINPNLAYVLLRTLVGGSTLGACSISTNTWLTDELAEKLIPYVLEYLPSNLTGKFFYYCKNITKIPDNFDWSKITDWTCAFSECSNLLEIKPKNMVFLNTASAVFYSCTSVKTIEGFDFTNVSYVNEPFTNCKKLENLMMYNIKVSLVIGSGTSWGHLLTLESLINTCKECIKQSATRKLTVGTANLAKLADVYVRFVDRNQTEIAEGEKGEVVVCEADNNDAMTIQEYMSLKNWTLA